jgi:hypothetical protein
MGRVLDSEDLDYYCLSPFTLQCGCISTLDDALCVSFDCIAIPLTHLGARVLQAVVPKIHPSVICVPFPSQMVLLKLYRIDIATAQSWDVLKTVRIL